MARIKHMVLILIFISVSSAQTQTNVLGDVVSSVEQAISKTNLQTSKPIVFHRLNAELSKIKTAMLPEIDFMTALKANYNRLSSASVVSDEELVQSVSIVQQQVNGSLRRELETAVGENESDRILEPFNTLQAHQSIEARDASLGRLKNYQKKYGFESAQLNVAEAFINHFLLRGFEAFGVDRYGNPGALEMIFSYNSFYMQQAAETDLGFQFNSGAEFGLRHYFFKDGWGEGSPLKPAYMSVGMVRLSEKTGALQNPFKGDARLGAFLGWGKYKGAYIFSGTENIWLISREFQILPFLF